MGTILPYASPGQPPRKIARMIRLATLVIGAACFGFAAMFVLARGPIGDLEPALYGTPLAPAGLDNNSTFRWAINREGTYYAVAAALIGLFLLGQWLFLLPRGHWRLTLSHAPRPMKRAAIVAGAIATLLITGLGATLLDFGNLWQKLSFLSDSNSNSDGQDYRIVWLIMLAVWLIWTVIFYRYFRSQQDGYTAFTRVFRGLLSGTVLELLVAAPVHAFHTDKENCYCARGSYTGLVFGGAAAIWLFGPGVFLLFLREKHRRGELLDQAKE